MEHCGFFVILLCTEKFLKEKTVFEKYYRGDCYEEVLEKKCSIINGVQPVDGK